MPTWVTIVKQNSNILSIDLRLQAGEWQERQTTSETRGNLLSYSDFALAQQNIWFVSQFEEKFKTKLERIDLFGIAVVVVEGDRHLRKFGQGVAMCRRGPEPSIPHPHPILKTQTHGFKESYLRQKKPHIEYALSSCKQVIIVLNF